LITVSKGRAAQGASYFEKDDYYKGNSGQWWGKGAEELSLSGEVEHSSFLNTLNGYDSNGQALTQSAGKENRVAYTDVTMSPPKSISLLAVLDDRMHEAHRKAVEATLKEIEKNYSLTRRGKGGAIKETTGNLVVAKFDHFDSREVDPQLHTHCVIVNGTQRADGKWGALENKPILQDQKMLSMLYQAQLTKELHLMGVATRKSSRVGVLGNPIKGIELQCVDDEMIEKYSKRAAQVKELTTSDSSERETMNKRLEEGAITKTAHTQWVRDSMNHAKLATRKLKDVDTAPDIRENNFKDIRSDFFLKIIADARTLPIKSYPSPNDVVKATIADLEENEAVFNRKDILQTAFSMSHGSGVAATDIEKEIPLLTEEISTGIYTTARIKEAAVESVQIANNGRNRSPLHIEPIPVINYLNEVSSNGINFKQSQRDTIETLAISSDTVNILQGDAGTGKTFALEHLQILFNKNEINVRGLAPTGKAAQGLQDVGIESSTIDSFFLKKEPPQKGEVWVVDESSMIGNLKMVKLLKKAEEFKAKLILVGDIKQLQAVDAGKAFSELQNNSSITKCDMSERIRQKTEIAKEIVSHANNKNPRGAVEALLNTNSIKESSNPQELQKMAVTDYLVSKNGGNSTVLLCQTNKSRKSVNAEVRSSLKSDGIIQKGHNHTCLSAASISARTRRDSQNYSNGMVVNFSSKVGNIKAGTQGEISSVDLEKDSITVKHWDKSKGQYASSEINLLKDGQSLQVYNRTSQEFSVGDDIILLKNDKKLGFNNGDTAVVTAINEEGDISIRKGRNTTSFSLKSDYNYLDYGYALTNYKSQGSTYDKAIILSDKTSLTNAEEFYVGVTRAKYEITAYVDSIPNLEKFAGMSQRKESVLEHYQEMEKNIEVKKMEQIKAQEAKLTLEKKMAEKEKLEQEKKLEEKVPQKEAPKIENAEVNKVIKKSPSKDIEFEF
jgi:conjugative relaxase-like TrwC/TraI family protein